MRNLKVNIKWHVYLIEKQAFSGKLCIGGLLNTLYYATSKGIFEYEQDAHDKVYLDWGENGIGFSTIISFDYVISSNSLCVITNEDIIIISLDTDVVEVVGNVSDGIMAACWSPDQEILIVITKVKNMIIMTSEYDVISEISLESSDFGEKDFITVGWGKKETQFHGSKGKDAAKVVRTIPEPIHEYDDRNPRITFRGDGQLFAVNYVRTCGIRQIGVFNREGKLQYTSEEIDSLEQPLSWKPMGSVIASSRKILNKNEIIFFEKNGLLHGQFSISTEEGFVIKELFWNSNSDILAVWLQHIDGDINKLQLWTVSNYMWHLKQVFILNGIEHILWHIVKPYVLLVLTKEYLYTYFFTCDIDHSKGCTSFDLGQVGVINGSNLKITPFRIGIVPPPLSAYEVQFSEQIHSIVYASPVSFKSDTAASTSFNTEDSGFIETIDPPGSNCNNICVIHGVNSLTFLSQCHISETDIDKNVVVNAMGSNGFATNCNIHKVICKQQLEWSIREVESASATDLFNWTWISKNYMLASCSLNNKNYLILVSLLNISGDIVKVEAKTAFFVEEPVAYITQFFKENIVAIQLFSGIILRFETESMNILPWYDDEGEVKYPNLCTKIALCKLEDTAEVLPIGLTEHHHLYIGRKLVLMNCSSFCVHNDHLLLTTITHTLLMVPFLKSAFIILGKVKDYSKTCIGKRNIERGSRIVIAIPSDTKIVLQMPRGNIEIVNPSHLVVHTLKQLLNSHQYYVAMDLMRKHRINLNLFYDHDPKAFINNTSKFVESINNSNWIDIFLASLSSDDVTKNLYFSNYYSRSEEDNLGKIDIICKALRQIMEIVDNDKYFLPILTSHIKMSHSEMNVALQKVYNIKHKCTLFEEGLRHLLYFVDANELYNVALGMYNFEIVLIVAEKSHKDPKEYLPFLNSLKKLNENYRRFKIDIYLKNYVKALTHMENCEESYASEVIAIISKNNLFSEALSIFSKNSNMIQYINKEYGNYLVKSSLYEEAGLIYERGEYYKEAMQCYDLCKDWRQKYIMMKKLEEIINWQSFALDLKEEEKFIEAAEIYDNYCKDVENAVDCFVNASAWDNALMLCYKYNRIDLIECPIRSSALDQQRDMLEETKVIQELFKKRLARLHLVRDRLMNNASFKDSEHFQVDNDLYSETSTATGSNVRTNTSISGRTYRSAKNKRKLERKKYSLKEGSPYEDLALTAVLHNSMSKMSNFTKNVYSLLKFLVRLNHFNEAVDLQIHVHSMIHIMEKSKTEIWPLMSTEDTVYGPDLTSIDITKAFQSDSYQITALQYRLMQLEPHLQYPPALPQNGAWSLKILKR